MSASTSPLNVLATPNISFLASTAASLKIYSPAQIRAAYGFSSSSLTGAGQTIAIVDAYNDPTIRADLATFDKQFGIAAPPNFTIEQELNGTKAPAYNAGWATEIALDVEWAHAIAPGANIMLVEANTASLSDLLNAVNFARQQTGVSVVSMSWGASDFSGEGTYDSYFTTPAGHTGVTFVASSGDSGAGASWPAISSNVLAVGGTVLNLNANGTYASESAWSGSGGGYSKYEAEGSFQRSVQTTGMASDPDVAYDASPNTGFYVYDSSSGRGNWYDVGGTSAGAPQWSALIALANQGRAQAGKAALNNALANIYSLSSSDFHDVTTGSNGNAAKAGYDLATGRGSPIANLVIRDLINATNATTASSTAKTTAISGTFKSMTAGDPVSVSLGSPGQSSGTQHSSGSSTSSHDTSSGDSTTSSAAAMFAVAADDQLGSATLNGVSLTRDANFVNAASWHAGDEPGALIDAAQSPLNSLGDESDQGLAGIIDGWQSAADQLADTIVAASPADAAS